MGRYKPHLDKNYIILMLTVFVISVSIPNAFAANYQVIISPGDGSSNNCATNQNCFSPNVVSINPGDTVTWANDDTVGHTATSGHPSDTQTGTIFDSSLIPSGKTYTSPSFNTAGTYNYFCQVHPWMTGNVIVGSFTSGISQSDITNLNIMPISGQSPLTVSFNVAISGMMKSTTWSFGDGSPSVTGVLSISHTYQHYGNYIGTVEVDFADGQDSARSFQISVTQPPSQNNQLPITQYPGTHTITISKGAADTNGQCSDTSCFNPSVIQINPGSTVTWINVDSVGHTATSGHPSDNQTGTIFDSSLIASGRSYSFTFQNVGAYPYFCQVHPWMAGEIVVESSGITTTSNPSTVEIDIHTHSSDPNQHLTFYPQSSYAYVGDKIEFGNGDTVSHEVVSGTPDSGPSGKFDSGTINPGQYFSYTLTEYDVGTFSFYDKTYPWMTGNVMVQGTTEGTKVIHNVGADVGDGKTTFDVQYQSVKNIISSSVDPQDKSVSFVLVGQTSQNSNLVLSLPSGLITPPFTGVQIDGQFTKSFTITNNQGTYVVIIPISAQSQKVSIIGTSIMSESTNTTMPPAPPSPYLTTNSQEESAASSNAMPSHTVNSIPVSMLVSTDKSSYSAGDYLTATVSISGVNTEQSIDLQISDPTNTSIVTRTVTTNSTGMTSLQLKLPDNTKEGNYQITAISSINGRDMVSSSVFTVHLNHAAIQNKISQILSGIHERFNNNDDIDTLIYKAKAFEQYSRFVDSFLYYDKALTMDPSNEEAKAGKDDVYNKMVDNILQLINYDKILQSDSNSIQAISSECTLLVQLGAYNDAYSFCEKAVANHDSTIFGSAYAVFVELGKYDEVSDLVNSLPNNPYVDYLKIPLLYHQGKYDEIIKTVDIDVQLNSNNQYYTPLLLLMKAATLEKTGDYDDANKYFNSIGASSYEDQNTLKGTTFYSLGDFNKAVYYLEKAQPQTEKVGYMKVIAYDEIAKSNAPPSITLNNNQGGKGKSCFLFWCW